MEQPNSTLFHLIPLYHIEGLRQYGRSKIQRGVQVVMHECPKCGFVQPKDRYCANCGLDIESYTPVPEPLLKKLTQSTGFQIFMVIAVVLTLGLFIYISQKERIEAQLAKVLEPQSESESPPPPTPQQTARAKTPPPPPVQSSTESAEPAAPSVASPTAKILHVTFAEVSKTLLQQLASEGQVLSETAQTRSFLTTVENLNALKERDPEFEILSGGENGPLRIGAPLSFSFTHLNAQNEDIGLNLQIAPSQIGESNLEIDIEGGLHLRGETDAPIANQEINANYAFAARSTLVLVGFLPRESIKSEDTEQFAGTPLAIYQSTSFLNGITDFAIFVQVR